MIVPGTIKIGVLGGIGPESSALFYTKLINKLQKSNLIKSNKDYPQIVINSINASEPVNEEFTDEELKLYIKGLQELDNHNPDFIVIVCNTMHYYFELFQSKINSRIIDLREEVQNHLISNNISSVTVFGSPTTIKKEIYDFDKISNINVKKEESVMLLDAIYNYNQGLNKKFHINTIKYLANKYSNENNKIILACTEFSTMFNNNEYIDVMDILLKSTIQNFIKLKNGK